MSDWQTFVDTMTDDRADLIRDFMVRMRTREGVNETVSCLMAAIHMLDRPGGRELAERMAAQSAAGEASDGGVS